MPSSYSSNLRLELQATGENTATWGTRANTVFELLEDAVSGYLSIALSDADLTLSTVNGAVDQSRNMILSFTGTLTSSRTITIPTVSKVYYMRNSTTGGFPLNVKTAAGNTITIASGNSINFFCDGTNCVKSFELDLGEVTSGTLSLANGGTGATTASAARTNLGLSIGSNVQAYDAGLQSIATLTTSADTMIYTTAMDVYATTALTPFARGLLNDTSASSALSTLGVSNFMKTVLDDTTAGDALTTLGVSAFMQTVLDDTSSTTARATLGANNASNLTTGTVPDARLSGNVLMLNSGSSGSGISLSNQALQMGGGTNFDEIWHDDGANTWYITTDAPSTRYSGDTGSIVKAGRFESTAASTESFRAVASGGNDVYITFYQDATRRAYIQFQDGTAATQGFFMFNDVTDDRLILHNTNSINALKFHDDSIGTQNVIHTGNMDANGVAQFSTASSSTTTSFPLGHPIVMYTAGNTVSRNASAVPCLSTADTKYYRLQGTSSAGTALSGTWRGRGHIGDDWVIMQRVA